MRKLYFAALALGLNAVSAFGADVDVCAKSPMLIEEKIATELNTGIRKKLVVIAACDSQFKDIFETTIQKNLWKNTFSMRTKNEEVNFVTFEEFKNELCSTLSLKDLPHCPKQSKNADLVIVINPYTVAVSHLIDDWTKRNAGVYRNMGMRLRWQSLSDIEKSEKVIFKTNLGKK